MLSNAGYRVITANNGREAMRALADHGESIKLCITDVVMPGFDGIELSRRIRRKYPSIKIIAVSGYPLGVDKKELEEAGIVDWIQKPFEAKSMMGAVQNIFRK
jgi:CheY-like chemotaxis protein